MQHKTNVIKPLSEKNLIPIMNKIGLSVLHDTHAEKIINGFRHGVLTVEEKNHLLVSIIIQQIESGSKYLNGFKTNNSCPTCNGKGFNIHLLLEMTTACPGTHDCLPCKGSGIMTKTCLRCGGYTLKTILDRRKLIVDFKNDHIPGMSQEDEIKFKEEFGHYATIDIRRINPKFIEENRDKTFRVIKADDQKKYSYIQKNPCRACKGTGRFEYKNAERTIKCPGCHGKGKIKSHLKSTNKVKFISKCNKCGGSGQGFASNPVINLRTMSPEMKKVLEDRGLLK